MFIPEGNLLVTNVDMDAVQVTGLCRSVLTFNPEYSGIPKDTPPEQAAPKFTKESLDAFSSFVYSLGVQRITGSLYFFAGSSPLVIGPVDWWRHKQMHHWIIPCLIKSQSSIPADIWESTPSTTNTNEAQHHWTNTLTGIKLIPCQLRRLKVIVWLIRMMLGRQTMSLETGILSNPNNKISHHMAHNSQRQFNAAHRSRESH
ncbi:hypothetical protein K438DRAFT_1974045 [Mycena galopus ATCC 62051]|nr:hypothetical protein K438DRAFT_1974045 [Mycena galopus ATCC 62051]